MSGKLLCLDLASNVGWALFDTPTTPPTPPRFGTVSFEGQGLPRILGGFSDWLNDFYAVNRFDALAWEAPFLKPGDKVDKMKILIGLVAIAFAFTGSSKHPMPHLEVGAQELKKRMTGNSFAKKPDIIKACQDLGWKVGSDHEADALGVGVVAYRRIWPLRAAA